MKLPIVFAIGCAIFLLGIPASLSNSTKEAVQALGHTLIISGSIIVSAYVIARSIETNLK